MVATQWIQPLSSWIFSPNEKLLHLLSICPHCFTHYHHPCVWRFELHRYCYYCCHWKDIWAVRWAEASISGPYFAVYLLDNETFESAHDVWRRLLPASQDLIRHLLQPPIISGKAYDNFIIIITTNIIIIIISNSGIAVVDKIFHHTRLWLWGR